MYYVVETAYVGPNSNDARYVDASHIDICTLPGRTNRSNDIRVEGWLGTTNDWDRRAHGVYERLDEALLMVADLCPNGLREVDVPAEEQEYDGVVARFKPGQYERLGPEATRDWVYEALAASPVTAETTDEELARLVEDYRRCAEEEDQRALDVGAIAQLLSTLRATAIDRAAWEKDQNTP